MKTNSKMAFGFSVVKSGVRKIEYAPEVVALSTDGGFRITPQVSAALGVQHGDYLMFLSTVNDVTEAINTRSKAFSSFCAEQGLNVDSPEAAAAFHGAYDMVAVAKGILLKNSKGIALTITERMSKKDREAYVRQNFDDCLEAGLQNGSNEVKTALTRDGISQEEQIEILATMVQGRELPKHEGCKLANSSSIMGVGTVLTCTDNNIWKQLKADLSEDERGTINRCFEVDPTAIQKAVMSNGFEDVEVPYLVLGGYTDKKVERGAKKTEVAE